MENMTEKLERINTGLAEITKKQELKTQEINKFNEEKSALIQSIVIDEIGNKRIERFLEMYKRIKIILSDIGDTENSLTNINRRMLRLYLACCRKIFANGKLITSIKFPPDTDKEHSYRNLGDRDICFNLKGIGYQSYYGSHRIQNLDYLHNIIGIIKSVPALSTINAPPSKKLLYQKLISGLMNYETFKTNMVLLKIPNQSIDIIKDDSGYSFKYYTEKVKHSIGDTVILSMIDNRKLELSITSTGSRNGAEFEISPSDFEKHFDFEKRIVVSQLNDSILDKIEESITKLEDTVKKNRIIYEKLKDEVGIYLFSEMV